MNEEAPNPPLTQAEIDAALTGEASDISQPPAPATPQEIDDAIKQEWYAYQAGIGQNAAATIDHRKIRMLIFDRWLTAKHPTLTYLMLTKDIIRDHVQFLIDSGYKPNTITASFNSIKALYYFLTEEQGLLQSNPCPAKARVRSQHSTPDKLIPFAALMQMREEAYAPGRFKAADNNSTSAKIPGRRNILAVLKRYTIFEVFLSTGMTLSELNRIVADDINWNDREYDKELERESPYTCGSIMLNPEEIGVKKRHFRKVWLNPIATKLLKAYMHHFRISGSTPVFPWLTNCIYNMMRDVGDNVIKEMKPFLRDPAKVHRRTKNKTEVQIDPDAMSTEIIKSIQKQQEREVLRDQYQIKTDLKYDINQGRMLGPHLLRHACACAMLYRNYNGSRNDVIGVKRILGHALESNIVYTYIDHNEFIRTDREWKILMCGTPKSYWQLMYKLEELPALEQHWQQHRAERKRKSSQRKRDRDRHNRGQ